MYPRHMFSRRARGTALVMGLIMSVIVTGLIMTLSWGAGVQTKTTGDLIGFDRSWYAAEAGAQRAAWYIKSSTSVTQPLTGTINGCSYSVTWTAGSGNTQRVTSVGTYGSARSSVLVSVTPPVTTPNAGLSAAQSLSLKNLSITGDVLVGQDITFQPGAASITGNLIYGTNLNGSASVSGTTAKGTWSGINWTSLQNTLSAAAGATGASGTGKSYDFSSVSGTNKVIYVNGNVTDPIFVGSGTLYVNGSVSLSSDPGSSTPVNIVCTGDLTTANNMSYHGSLYIKTNWNRGKIDLTGSVYMDGSMNQSNNGNSSITFTSTPWFDNRTAGGGSGSSTTTFASFAGPNP